MDKDTNKTERQNYQITPFTYEDRAVRTVMVENEPWFVAKDVCDILGIKQPTRSVEKFPGNEVLKVSSSDVSNTEREGRGGAPSFLCVNEPGLYRLIFQSRKPGAEEFKTWVFYDVLPQIRKTGSYGAPGLEGFVAAGEILRLFSACRDMTLQRINKVIFYFTLDPQLSCKDIAKLLDTTPGTIGKWRLWLTPEMARSAAAALGINADGIADSDADISPYSAERPGFPLALPAKGAQNAQP